MDETRPLTEDDASSGEAAVAGTTCGRYVLVRRIGAGGCGEVFVAYDPVLDRRLALKVLFGEGSSAWAREARMLAKVEHPHIVSVYDAGEHENRGFLATEFVDGPDLAHWLAERDGLPDPLEALALLMPVGEALGSAHEGGIVHGDVKPANILVAQGGARITDFGVARVIDREQPEGAAAWAGTPAYMAPEQLEGQASDARSDQYAFCLTLWEALFGAPSFEGETTEGDPGHVPRGAAGTTAQAVLGKPATGAGRILALAEARRRGPTVVPKRAGLDPAVGRALQRGLHPEASERFPSMRALVKAITEVPAQRAWRGWMMAGSTAVIGVVGLASYSVLREPQTCMGAADAVASVWNAQRRDAVAQALGAVAMPMAEAEAAATTRALDQHAAAWIEQHTEVCRATATRKEQSEALLDLRMDCLHRNRRELDSAVEVLLSADATVLKNAGRLVAGIEAPLACRELERSSQDDIAAIPNGQEEAVEAVRDALVRATSLSRAGRFAASRDVAKDAVDRARELDYPPVLARALLRLGYGRVETSEMDTAGDALREALELALEHGPPEVAVETASLLAYWAGNTSGGAPAGAAYAEVSLALVRRASPQSQLHAGVLTNLGVVRSRQSRYPEARELFERARDMLEARLGPVHYRVLDMVDNLAAVDMEVRDMKRALQGFEHSLAQRREAFGPRHFSTVMVLSNLGQVHAYIGEYEQAATYYREGIEIGTETVGPDDPQVAGLLTGLANAESKLGKSKAAGGHVEQALAIYRAAFGAEHPMIADALIIRGQLHFLEGDYAAAEPIYAEALRITRATMEPTHPQVAVCSERVALANMGLERWEQAEEMFTEALTAFEASGVGPAAMALSLGQRGAVRVELGRFEGAAEDLAASAKLQRDRGDPPYPDDTLAYNALGRVSLQLGREATAKEAYGWSLEVGTKIEAYPGDLAEARAGLAMMNVGTDRAKALTELQAQLDVLENGGPDYADTAAWVRAFLDEN